jgi:hypothetical protein
MNGKIVGHKGSNLRFLVLGTGNVQHHGELYFTVKVSSDPVFYRPGVLSQAVSKTEKVWYTTASPIFMTKSVLDKLEVMDEINDEIVQGFLAEEWLIERAITCLYNYLGPIVGPVYGMEKFTLAFNLAVQKFRSTR